MSSNHWADIHRYWDLYTPPPRPNGEVVDALRRQVEGTRGRVLLLGVTPELAGFGDDLVAVDKSRSMIAHLWPGNTRSRRALVGNWLNTNFVPSSFGACIGDGSLNVVRYPDETQRLCGEIARLLTPGGRLALRVFTQSDRAELPEAVERAARSGAYKSFHGFKWRLSMAIALERRQPNVEMGWVYEAFERMFPDRGRLAAQCGWNRDEIETVELLKGSSAISAFPTRRQLIEVVAKSLSHVRLVAAGSYEVAEHCPLLVAEKA